MTTREGYVKILGFRLFYRSFGKSLRGTVLGLHGGPGCSQSYMLPLADLTQFGYRVVLFDQIGCGRSDLPKGAEYYTERRAVEEVEAVRKALRLGRVHLVGNSYGGALALDVALAYPRSFRSLVISSGLASLAEWLSENSKLWSRMPRQVRKAVSKYSTKRDILNPRYLVALDAYYRKHGCRLRVWPYDDFAMFDSLHQYESKVSANPIGDRLKDWDITDRLPEIHLPTLVMGGQYDHVPLSVSRTIHRGIPGSRLVVFPDGSHLPMWENRVEFIEAIRDFLDGLGAN